MKTMKINRNIGIILFVIFAGLVFLFLCAFKLPADSAKDLIPLETIQNQINNFKLITVIALLILGISLAVNVLLILYLFKLQNEVSEMVQAFKNFNGAQDAVDKIAEKVKIYNLAGEDEKDKIEFIKRNI